MLVAVGAESGEYRSQRLEVTVPALEAALHQNTPNPFNPSTTIRFDVPEEASVTIEVFDALGAKVRTLVHRTYAPGSWAADWDGRDDRGQAVASGVYYYRMRVGSTAYSKKMVLLK
jgi:flagellar hook assembly protein FlgD